MNLSEFYLLKSFRKISVKPPAPYSGERPHSYIKRERRSYGWRYWYVEPKRHMKTDGGFGEQWQGLRDKPRAAFNKLLVKKKGQVEDVFTARLPFFYRRKGQERFFAAKKNGKKILVKTGIDLVWGNKHKDIGIDHIIDKHLIKFNHYNNIDEIFRDLQDSFAELNKPHSTMGFEVKGMRSGQPQITFITKKGIKLVLGSKVKKLDDGTDLIKFFILTSYEEDEDWKAFENTPEERKRKRREVEEYIDKIKKAE